MLDLKSAMAKAFVLQQASSASLAALYDYGVLKRYAKGRHLFFDKDAVESLYFVVEGKAALYKINAVQDKKVIFIYGPGHMLNEVMLQNLPASVNCEILAPAVILSFPKTRFLQVMAHDFNLSRAVMESMALKIRRLYRQIQNTSGSMRLGKRLAAKLWKLSRDHGVEHAQGVEIDMDLSVSFLAELLGAQRETVSRQIKLLGEQNLVLFQNKRFIITNREKLLQYIQQA